MDVFDRNINFDALFKFSQMCVGLLAILSSLVACVSVTVRLCVICRSRSTQLHLKNVYSSLAACMFVAAAGSYVHVVTRLFQVKGASSGGASASGGDGVWLIGTPPASPVTLSFVVRGVSCRPSAPWR